jgi:hypothetical protein
MPALLALIPAVVSLAEKLFPKGSDGVSTGSQKKSFVLRILEVVFDEAAAAGKLPPWIVDSKDIVLKVLDGLIEAAVAALKKGSA